MPPGRTTTEGRTSVNHKYNTRLSVRNRRNSSTSNSDCSCDSEQPVRSRNNSRQLGSYSPDSDLRMPRGAEDRPFYIYRNNPLDPCAEPDIKSYFKCFWLWALILGSIGIGAVCTSYYNGNLDRYFSGDGSNLRKDLSNIRCQIDELKQTIVKERDDTTKKMQQVEDSLANLTRAVKENTPPQKCTKLPNTPTSDNLKSTINMFEADKTGMPDYALESAGGSILTTRDTVHINVNSRFTFLGWTICTSGNEARTILQPGTAPGECWAFKGTTGIVVIKLLATICVSGVSLEHIPKRISPSTKIDTAPKEFSVWRLESADNQTGVELGRFIYDENGDTVQYFPVIKSDPARFVEIKFHSNYGNPDYTCVYRVRIHGERVIPKI